MGNFGTLENSRKLLFFRSQTITNTDSLFLFCMDIAECFLAVG